MSKYKFKEGQAVEIVNLKGTGINTNDAKLTSIGKIIEVDRCEKALPYRVIFEGDYWYFNAGNLKATDKEITSCL
jgi:hypothetical protein